MQEFFEKSGIFYKKSAFLVFFSYIVWWFELFLVPLHTISKTNKFNPIKIKVLWSKKKLTNTLMVFKEKKQNWI
jgi:hypothetical protein